MEADKKSFFCKSQRINPLGYVAILLANVFVFACICFIYIIAVRDYSEKIFNENVKNIENINWASANAALTYTNSLGIKINDAIKYIMSNNLNVDDAIKYISESNTDQDKQFHLILSGSYGNTGVLSFGDYSGVSIRTIKNKDGDLVPLVQKIKYGSGYYDILRIFTDTNDENSNGTCIAPEFTDPATKLKCFAVYRHIILMDADGKKKLYTILLAVNSKMALESYNIQYKYDRQSTVLINSKGDYIIKNSNYRNANFYDYIVNYNGLSQRWKAKIRNSIWETSGKNKQITNLFYKDHRGEDCIFSVTAIVNGWYSITCAPLSSFNTEDDDVDYSLFIILAFLALFVVNGVAVYVNWKMMRHNVKIAELATAEANNANAAKSLFLSTMSHELRTPLNAIIGFTSLSMDCDDTFILKSYIKKIDMSSKLLLQLIGDILDISAIESNKIMIDKCDFDITKNISSLSDIYSTQCTAKDIDFTVVLKNIHSEILVGDPIRVNQILLNLLSNAVKFTPRGGKICLKVEAVPQKDATIIIRFDVSDTGCGISDELKLRLFKPFERGTGDGARKFSGTGLGLSIAKKLTELMHGQIGVESREGEGTCFWVEIPFATSSESKEQSFSPINLRVLAAVYNEDERENLGLILSNFGVPHRLTADASSAFSLLQEAKDGQTPFNLCILDWKMPDLNAVDAAKKIREVFDHKALRIMILAYDLAEARAQYLDAGADLVFGKPIFASTLYDTLVELAGNKVQNIACCVQNDDLLRGKHALLVEDNEINVEIAQLILNKFGLLVETAENGQLGYEAFVASAPGYFDVIFMDIQMPVMNGYEATRAIRASAHPDAKSIPILAMTADVFSDDVAKAKAAGINEHLAKPIEPNTIYLVLKEYLL